MKITFHSAIPALCLILVTPGNALAQDDDIHREITQVTDKLYRFQNGGHNAAFLVTDDGIVLTDPVNAEAAAWLKAELGRRFDVPVTHVLYSHYHFDHASGGAEFEDTAMFIGHERMVENLQPVPEGTPLLPEHQAMDANNDNILQLEEAFFLTPEDMARVDINSDGGMSRHERRIAFNPQIRVPGETFTDTKSITLGNQTVEIGHYTEYHSTDMSYILFPDQDAIYLVDLVTVKSSPGTGWGATGADDWIAALEAIEKLDFDIVIGGHGPVGNKADVTALREFFEEVLAAVSAGIERGESRESMQASIGLEEYADWNQHAARMPGHVAAAYQSLTAE